MKQALFPALLFIAACGEPTAPKATPPPPPASPLEAAIPEPDVITVKHVLVAFKEGARSLNPRSREEAAKLAEEVLKRARAGEDFDKLMKEFSSDTGGGTYAMANHGVTPGGPEQFQRSGMVPAFGNVGFRLKVGETGLAPHDPVASPFGWHVIKRVK